MPSPQPSLESAPQSHSALKSRVRDSELSRRTAAPSFLNNVIIPIWTLMTRPNKLLEWVDESKNNGLLRAAPEPTNCGSTTPPPTTVDAD